MSVIREHLAAWYAAKPGRRERHIAAMRRGTIAHNRLRGRIARATRWFPRRYYPVDLARRVIVNVPCRYAVQALAAVGIVGRGPGNSGGALLGWPGQEPAAACALAVLAARDARRRRLTLNDIMREVEPLRALYGLTRTVSRGAVLRALTAPRALGWIDGRTLWHRGPRGYALTPAGRAAAGKPATVIAALGASLAERFPGFVKVDAAGRPVRNSEVPNEAAGFGELFGGGPRA